MTATKPEETSKPAFEQYALVEIMGHVRVAGLVTEEPLFGTSMMRVDVPDEKGETAYTRYFGGRAIHSITPVTKEIAIALAQNIAQKPVSVYDLQPRQIGGRGYHEDEDLEEDRM